MSNTVHINGGFLSSNNGVETPMLYAMGGWLLAFVGPGAYSLDGLLGWTALSTMTNASLAIAFAVVAGALTAGLARNAPAPHNPRVRQPNTPGAPPTTPAARRP